MIDETDEIALERIKAKYGDQIESYVYNYWKGAYLAPPPKNAFCSTFTRYRNCMKITHVILKDGRRIPLQLISPFSCLMIIIFIILAFLTSK